MSKDKRFIYLLNIITAPVPVLTVSLGITHLLKTGHYCKPKLVRLANSFTNGLIDELDKEILHWLAFIRKQCSLKLEDEQYPLTGANGVALLKQLLATERCYWANPNRPLLLGTHRKAFIEWVGEGSGLQRLQCRIPGETNIALPLTPPWYLDLTQHLCGPLETGYEPETIAALLAAPPLRPEQVKKMMLALRKIAKPQQGINHLRLKAHRLKVPVIPYLYLSLINLELKSNFLTTWQKTYQTKLPLAELRFNYQGIEITLNESHLGANHIQDCQPSQIQRDYQAESAAISLLESLGLKRLKHCQHPPIDNHYAEYFLINDNNDTQAHLNFLLQHISDLRRKGWEIIVDETYPYHLIDDKDTWYSKLEQSTHSNWFNLELGITLHGENINLLPTLVDLIQENHQLASPWLMVPLSDKHYLPIPRERIANILKILTELYDAESLNGANQLSLSKLRAAQLMELPNVLGVSKLHWIGNDKLLTFAESLKSYQTDASTIIPENLKIQLRSYQQEGLHWLKFLRKHGLGGILADDMGLGKTIQTLAHLLEEKNQGRQILPNLLIVPTSLVMNWRSEAERYAPDLKILILHGNHRQDYFDDLIHYDLIITTYPLLLRDKTTLLAQAYYYLILDEAHLIKNPQAKMTQIVRQINSHHRLCLTGTPLENHLGELWSLFNFLLPGLLGKHKQFKRIFQIPIEKNADQERQAILKNRIAPFLLRRTKEAVAKELPPKTEIIRQVELEDAQRDLYEAIRLAMHQRVIQAIQDKGLNKSHITILDALLRLRQVCCDPRLVKLPSVNTANIPSAKLLLLMEMLPNLIAEGRRILLFSQFTQMLHLIEGELQAQKIPYVILTGQTKERAVPIELFQSGAIPLFLISLKAGGVGLNLTAADIVIHCDPWWNPAVENQANDRAHRIGQDKPIIIYKLIAHGTVEDKILEMQQRKQALSQNLLDQAVSLTTQWDNSALEKLFRPIDQFR